MATVTFDTHAFIKQLKKAGFEESQAESLSEAFKKAQEAHIEELVTKHDLKELELKINAQLLLLKWMMGVILAGIVSLVIKAFFV